MWKRCLEVFYEMGKLWMAILSRWHLSWTLNNEKQETMKKILNISFQTEETARQRFYACVLPPFAFTELGVLYINILPILMGHYSVCSYWFYAEDCIVWRNHQLISFLYILSARITYCVLLVQLTMRVALSYVFKIRSPLGISDAESHHMESSRRKKAFGDEKRNQKKC